MTTCPPLRIRVGREGRKAGRKFEGVCMRAVIYARVSTKSQNPDTQVHACKEYITTRKWQHIETYVDVASTKSRRLQKERMMTDAHRRRFDVVVVWSLDRLSRSLRELINDIHTLNALGIQLVCLKHPIDTSTPVGTLLVQLIGMLAEFERALISDRVRAGLEVARAKGKRLGRPPKVTPAILAQIKELRKQGLSWHKIAKQLKLNVVTVWKAGRGERRYCQDM